MLIPELGQFTDVGLNCRVMSNLISMAQESRTEYDYFSTGSWGKVSTAYILYLMCITVF